MPILPAMDQHLRITVKAPDRPGLLAALCGRLYDLGADLGDVTFARAGDAASFSGIAAFAGPVSEAEVAGNLEGVGDLSEVVVEAAVLDPRAPLHRRATHVVHIQGQDRPGLLARLAEGFTETGADVVRLEAERGDDGDYGMTFEIDVAPEHAASCLAAASNTAEAMGLRFEAEEAPAPAR
jgi:glycine cleavage system transcriptional repressor